MKNKKLIIGIIGTIIFIVLVSVCGYFLYRNYQFKHAVKIVKLIKEEIEVYDDIKLNDLIESINGKLLENPKVDTSKLGKKTITFKYINDDNIKVDYTISVDIVDKTPPIISQVKTYNVDVNSKLDIAKELFCGDNYDDKPKCMIEGDYDLNKVGKYPVSFVGEDSSNNKSSHDFIINVKEKSPSSSSSSPSGVVKTTDFKEVVQKYKNSNNKIGLDVSHWQGDIDFDKVKAAGVEFVYIRVGRGNGIGKDYVLDTKFKQNIEGFNRVGIPVGVYFFSYANSKKDAEREAKWVLKQIKKYKVDLEIAFDWENWDSFQEFNLSFKKLTDVAETFSKTVSKQGYQGMLYSSKNYLENIWYPVDFPVWMAHYTTKTNYEGKYKVWQICNNGKVEGIDDNLVDINIMYQ